MHEVADVPATSSVEASGLGLSDHATAGQSFFVPESTPSAPPFAKESLQQPSKPRSQTRMLHAPLEPAHEWERDDGCVEDPPTPALGKKNRASNIHAPASHDSMSRHNPYIIKKASRGPTSSMVAASALKPWHRFRRVETFRGTPSIWSKPESEG